MKCTFILLLVFCSLIMGFSQGKTYVNGYTYSKGYIVKNDGDTLRGLINLLDFAFPKKIMFRRSLDTEPEKISADSIKGFSTSKKAYERHRFKYDGDMLGYRIVYPLSITPGFPNTRLPVKWIEQESLLRVLVRGRFNLFSFRDPDNRDHFFYNSAERPELIELQHRQYLKTVNEHSLIVTSNYYQQQLLNLGSNCKTNIKFLKVTWFESELIKAMLALNNCFPGKT